MLKVLKVLFIAIFATQITLAQTGKLKTIVIDAGHGGKDPGTHRGDSKEKQIALAISLKLADKIQKGMPETKVVLTRKKDVFIELSERAAIANRNKADLFICIHVNANPHSSKLSGTEIYTLGLHRTEDNLELAKRENEVILMEDNYKKSYKGYDPNSPLAHIMMANFQNAFMAQSVTLASRTSKKIASVTGLKNRGVKQAGFVVLWQCSMPSIYVETGYITNATDKKFLDSESGKEKMAEAIFQALKAYNDEVK
jgi:N-acetylmuramoyl-L-alanine amidase